MTIRQRALSTAPFTPLRVYRPQHQDGEPTHFVTFAMSALRQKRSFRPKAHCLHVVFPRLIRSGNLSEMEGRMRRCLPATLLIVLVWAASASLAGAQSQAIPTESVTVNAQKLAPEEKLHDFVQAYAAPAGVGGKMARW